MSQTSSLPEVLKSGWAVKEGKLIKSWKKRWFVLQDKPSLALATYPDASHIIMYYRTPEQAACGLRPLGFYPIIKDKTSVDKTAKGSRKGLALRTPGVQRVFLFEPQGRKHPDDAEQTLEDWLEILTVLELPKGKFARLRMDTLGARPARDAFNLEDGNETEDEESEVADDEGAEGDAADPNADKLAVIAELKVSHPENRAMKHFDLDYYRSLPTDDDKAGLLQCVNSGLENADSGMGCYAMQPADYDRFKPFFSKVLADYHGVSEDAKHVNDWALDGVDGLPAGGKLDLAALGLPTLSMRVRVGRNLKEFPLPGAMTQQDRVSMEAKMCGAFEQLKAMPEFGGGYNSLTPGHADFVDQAGYQKLIDEHIMFKDMAADTYLAAAGIASDWPYGRGCYVSEDRGFIIWVGEEDHLRIMCMKKAAVLNEVFDRLKAAIDVVNAIEGLAFAQSDDYGVVTSCPTNLGTGMRASVHIPIPNLTADGTDAKAKVICKPLGLSVRGTGGEHTPIGVDGTCDISPSARFCITEAQIITALYNGLKLLKEEEAKAATGAAASL